MAVPPQYLSDCEQTGVFGVREASGKANTVAGSAGSGLAEPISSPSMAESVTRHALNPPVEDFTFLTCGLDTLDLGLYVSWDSRWTKTRTSLDKKKEQALGSDGKLDSTRTGRDFLHLPSGKPPNYRYHLQFPEYHIYIAISEEFGKSPNVYVTIFSQVLWHEPLNIILEQLEYDLEHFGGKIKRIQPSRVDLCADFLLIPSPSYFFLEDHRVSRSRSVRSYLKCGALETYYCGSAGSPVQLRLYHKGIEITKSDKLWFRNIWGTDQTEHVWRVEFQLRRAILHQFQISELCDLWRNISSIWEYLTGEWFSLRFPDNDKTERRTIHPWWQQVQNCAPKFGGSVNVKRVYRSSTMEPIQTTLAHITGRMISLAVRSDIKDRKEAIFQLSKRLYHGTDDDKFLIEYRKRAVKMGYRGDLDGEGNDPETEFGETQHEPEKE